MDRRECRIGIQGVAGAEEAGDGLALSAGVFGTLVMHSPKVPHPDFSVKVIRHNLKILWLWKTLREKRWGYVAFVPAAESGMRVKKIS